MSELCNTLRASATLIATNYILDFRNQEDDSGDDKELGCIQIGGRRLLAEPLLILTEIFAIVETVVRVVLAFIAITIFCFIPSGNTKEWFDENIVKYCNASVLVSSLMLFVIFKAIFKNIYQANMTVRAEIEPIDYCVKPIIECLDLQQTIVS